MDAIKTGILIRQIRKEKNMTQQQLADAIHVSVPAISKWENGHGFPDITLLAPLASSLGISVSELLNGEKCEPEMNVLADRTVNDVIQLSEEQKKKKIIAAIVITATIVALLMLSLTFLLQDVGSVKNYFSPRIYTSISNEKQGDEWQRLDFGESGYLNFDSVFFSRICTNDANSAGEVHLKFIDVNGDVIIDNITIKAGESTELEALKRNTDYFVEIKCGNGQFFINFR